MELVKAFGGLQGYQQAVKELERELYRAWNDNLFLFF